MAKTFGYVGVAAATPTVRDGDCKANAAECMELMERAASEHVSVVVFPELSITGCCCGDLFYNQVLRSDAIEALEKIRKKSGELSLTVVVGMPLQTGGRLYNVAVVINKGVYLAVVPKRVVYGSLESRFFSAPDQNARQDTVWLGCAEVPFSHELIFKSGEFSFAVVVGEDLALPMPHGSEAALGGAQIILNPTASTESGSVVAKEMVRLQSLRSICGYVYSPCGYGESTTDFYYPGGSLIADTGEITAQGVRHALESRLLVSCIDVEAVSSLRLKNVSFQSACFSGMTQVLFDGTLPTGDGKLFHRSVNPHPFVPESENELHELCDSIFNAQTGGLATRLSHIWCKKAVIGVSGGLDSTLALLVTVKAFMKLGLDLKGVVGITMPGFGTTSRTYTNALAMMKALGVEVREISIKEACIQHFSDINHDPAKTDVTFENSQARERTQILMDVANSEGAIVVGTGDLSELALGWCTYNGDHMSMYGVNVGIPKTLMKQMVIWAAQYEFDETVRPYLMDVVQTPISPELLPADSEGGMVQKTENLVGPYELHDFFLYHFLKNSFSPAKILFLAERAFGEYDSKTIREWLQIFLRRFFSQQFKRSCMPDGIAPLGISLSPRSGWSMPSDMSSYPFLADCNLK